MAAGTMKFKVSGRASFEVGNQRVHIEADSIEFKFSGGGTNYLDGKRVTRNQYVADFYMNGNEKSAGLRWHAIEMPIGELFEVDTIERNGANLIDDFVVVQDTTEEENVAED